MESVETGDAEFQSRGLSPLAVCHPETCCPGSSRSISEYFSKQAAKCVKPLACVEVPKVSRSWLQLAFRGVKCSHTGREAPWL